MTKDKSLVLFAGLPIVLRKLRKRSVKKEAALGQGGRHGDRLG